MTREADDLSQEQSFAVRPMGPADVPAVVAIDRLSFPTPWPATSYLYELVENDHSFYSVLTRPRLDPPSYTKQRWYRWVREMIAVPGADEVTGYAGFRVYRREAHITTIAIHPDWRGKGLGELLLLEVVEKAVQLGANRITLEVRPSNWIARRMYEKYGFEVTGVRRGYYRDGEDAWLMAAKVNGNGYRSRLDSRRIALTERLLAERVRVGQQPCERV